MVKNRSTLLLILIILLCLALRFTGALTDTLSYDESFSLLISQTGPQGILTATLSMDEPSVSADIHPPTYYLLLGLWMQVFGTSVVAARALSVLLGVGILLNIYFLTKELFDQPTALLAGFCVAVLPFQVEYAADSRMYALLTCLLTLATLAFIKAIKSRSWQWWMIFSLAAAGAQYTHNLAVFYLVPLAFTALLKHDRKIVRNTLLAGLVAVALYIPWLIHIPAQFMKVQQHYWIARPSLVEIINLILRYIPNLPIPDQWMLPGLFAAFFCVAMTICQTVRAARLKLPGYRAGLWLGFLSFAPPILLWLFSQWTPVYVDRGLLASHAIFCVWFVWALTKTGLPRTIQVTAVVLLVFAACLGLSQYFTNLARPDRSLKAVSSVLQERVQPGEIVVHSNKLTYLPLFYYHRDLPMDFVIDEPGGPTDTFSWTTRKVLGVHEAEVISSAPEGATRVWFVILRQSVDEYLTAGYANHPHLQYMFVHYNLISEDSYGDVLVYLFEHKEQ